MAHDDGGDPFLDAASATAEQRFTLMLLRRVEALEAARTADEARLGALEARVARLERLTYDPLEDRFSDGACIDWFVCEPHDTAHACHPAAPPEPLTPAHWDAPVLLPLVPCGLDPQLEVHVPVERFGDGTRVVSMPAHDLTVRRLLGALHAFYAAPLTAADVQGLDMDGSDYAQDVAAALCEGQRVTWADMLGVRPEPPGTGERRRGPLSCSGRVRYEGLRMERPDHGQRPDHWQDQWGRLTLRLGS